MKRRKGEKLKSKPGGEKIARLLGIMTIWATYLFCIGIQTNTCIFVATCRWVPRFSRSSSHRTHKNHRLFCERLRKHMLLPVWTPKTAFLTFLGRRPWGERVSWKRLTSAREYVLDRYHKGGAKMGVWATLSIMYYVESSTNLRCMTPRGAVCPNKGWPLRVLPRWGLSANPPPPDDGQNSAQPYQSIMQAMPTFAFQMVVFYSFRTPIDSIGWVVLCGTLKKYRTKVLFSSNTTAPRKEWL